MYLPLSIRSVWESQISLSESDLLHMQLEYVKCVCHLDDSLVLPHMLPREKECTSLANQNTKHTLDQGSGDPCTITHAQVRFQNCFFIFIHVCVFVCVCVLKIHSLFASFSQECVCKDEECVCEDETSMCEERVATQVAAMHWDKVERKNRVLETHSALLRLQTLLMQTVSHAPVGEELSHAIHTHSMVSAKKKKRLTVSKNVDCAFCFYIIKRKQRKKKFFKKLEDNHLVFLHH